MKTKLIFVFYLFNIIHIDAQPISIHDLRLTAPTVKNCTPVKDQYMSSTCWSFASLSFLESEIIKNGKGETDLSEMFIARYSLLRKINLHLKLKGQNFFTPGGQFHDVSWVIKNHGLVPESVYPGKPTGQPGHNHAELDTLLSRYVKGLVADGVTEMDNRQQNFIDSVLDHYLGKVPSEFNYKGRIYTPYSFAAQALEIDPDNYIEITSYTHHPFYTSFVLEDKYNWTGDAYYNVPLDDFSRITKQALAAGYTVGWDGDAEDLNFNFYSGVSFLNLREVDDQALRQTDFQTGATSLNHMMHIVGTTKDRTGNTWYYIKNSWGDYSNNLGGYLFMREDYFKTRTVAIIVNKNAIPADILQKLHL